MNFAVTPRKLPVVEYIAATESACRNLPPNDAGELRSKVCTILKRHKKVESNITKEEAKALQDLKGDQSIKILPADKGKCTVVLDTETYHQKCSALLSDDKTYQKLSRDPTQGYKKQLVSILKDLKDKGAIDQALYYKLYPTTETPPKFYGLPKIHKKDNPLRPIVSSRGSITYDTAKYLATVISPVVGKTERHVKNSAQFCQVIKDFRVEHDEELRSYDVSALFTSVPVDKAVHIIQRKLEDDPLLPERTKLTPANVARLLEFCLNCTYFVYNGQFYRQIHGAAMGSPVSPIVCNAYMEDVEELAINTATNPPMWWYRYVDDTHTKLKKDSAEGFTKHLNTVDEDIKFTTEGEVDRGLAFLDLNTIHKEDGSLKVKVYRKATHTDQYLNFASNHPLVHKLGVVRTLHHRAKAVVTEPEDLKEEIGHVNQALERCGYPKWTLSSDKPSRPERQDREAASTDRRTSKSVALPYVKGLSETLRRTFLAHGANTYFKPHNTLRQILCSPRTPPRKNKYVDQSTLSLVRAIRG